MGTATVANGYTSTFGLSYCEGIGLTTSDDPDAIVGGASSSGTITISALDDGGATIITEFTVNYLAWGRP